MVDLLTFHDNILNELEKDVKNVAGGNLRYFSKNWYEYTNDKYTLDIITNYLKLDLKETQLEISSPPIPYQAKKMKLLQ